ncbi:MAG: hypothetical protein P8100_06455 [bacterium]
MDILAEYLGEEQAHVQLEGLMGSAAALTLASLFSRTGKQQHLVILPEKEKAAYFYNDLENLFEESDTEFSKKKVLFLRWAKKCRWILWEIFWQNLISKVLNSSRNRASLQYEAVSWMSFHFLMNIPTG